MQFRLTPAVKALSIICFGAFVVQQTADQFLGGNLLGFFALLPSGFVLEHRFWQLFTYAFLHGDLMHLVLNLAMLVFIGSELEAAWGTSRFLRFYFFCSIAAGLSYLFLQLFLGGQALHTPMVGASGAIYGLLMAYGLLFGNRVLLFMMLFPMKAKHFVWILAAIEFMSTVFSSRAGIAGIAHLGGMAAGWIYLWGYGAYLVMKRRRLDSQIPGGRPKKRRSAGHLKLVTGREEGKKDRGKDESRDSEYEDDSDNSPKTWH